MTAKLDIEGIRESIGHICAHIHHLTEAELQDNLRWLTARTQNLLTEIDRLRGELEATELKRSILYEGHGELLVLSEHLKRENDELRSALKEANRTYPMPFLSKGVSDE